MIREFFLGFIRIHILFHAEEGEIYGLYIKEELERHGYKLSYGTLYPTLHSLEKDGYLKSYRKKIKGRSRKYYTITDKGRNALKEARKQVEELMKEVL